MRSELPAPSTVENACVALRPAAAGDADMLLAWRNRAEIIALGALNRPVLPDEHRVWFARKLLDNDARIWIVEGAGVPVGQVRLDPVAAQEKVISVFVLSEFAGNGYGVQAIRVACRKAFDMWPELKTVRAEILKENSRSIRAFKRSGFSLVRRRNQGTDLVELACRRPMVVPHNRLTHGPEEAAAVAAVVRSGRWAGGAKVREFEDKLKAWARVEHAVCVGSGLGALRLGLSALGVGRGDRVLVPAYSCVALPNAVLANQARPVPVDIEAGTWNIDPRQAESSYDSIQAKAMIAVSTFGMPVDVQRLHGLAIDCIEDWAHGFMLAADGVSPAGLESRLAIQSLYATKLMGVGEGGVILTNSGDIADHVRGWRDYADQAQDGSRLNDKMTDISAALGMVQLGRLPDIVRRRRVLAEIYTAAFSAPSWLRQYVELPACPEHRVWYRYAIYLKHWHASEIIARLRAEGVLADMPVCDWRTAGSGDTVADAAFRGIVSLPLYPTLKAAEQAFVIRTTLGVLARYREEYEQ
jgi:dTDP-4-amino-4,6-dideoxygalactose transaminase/RimJ/RimL family protein N-acetyltransferase